MTRYKEKKGSTRNRFTEQAERKTDKGYMAYREKISRKDHSPKAKGMGFFIFLVAVFLLAYLFFVGLVFSA